MTPQLVKLLDRAVQDALWDGRVGVNVSGGLDSSTIVRLVHQWADVPTFTGWYDEPGYDECRYARMAVAKHPARHHEILITPDDFVENFDEMMRHFRPPFQGPGMFGQYMVAKYISENHFVTAVLSGEGSDELFGGYARLMHVAGAPMPDGYEDYRPPTDYPSNLRDALAYDYERLPLLLAVDDQALGAFGLEARAPFTDRRVVEYALRLSDGQRVGKQHLRAAVRGLVPDPIIDRTDKKGFPVPLVKWANERGNPVREFVGLRLGHLPDPEFPFDRRWWVELCETTLVAAAA